MRRLADYYYRFDEWRDGGNVTPTCVRACCTERQLSEVAESVYDEKKSPTVDNDNLSVPHIDTLLTVRVKNFIVI